jgi:hypothetical protein
MWLHADHYPRRVIWEGKLGAVGTPEKGYVMTTIVGLDG